MGCGLKAVAVVRADGRTVRRSGTGQENVMMEWEGEAETQVLQTLHDLEEDVRGSILVVVRVHVDVLDRGVDHSPSSLTTRTSLRRVTQQRPLTALERGGFLQAESEHGEAFEAWWHS